MRHLVLAFAAVPFLFACGGQEPELENEGPEVEVEVEPEVEPCVYPATTGLQAVGSIMPNVTWDPAYLDATTTTALSLEQVYCENQENQNVDSIVFVLVTEWCPNCPDYVRYVNGQAAAMAQNGAQLVFVDLQDRNYLPSTSEMSEAYIAQKIGDGAGFRVGSADAAPQGVIYNSPIWSGVPNAFVVRTSDMKVIASQETTNFMLDFATITANVDANDPTQPVFESRCGENGEEAFEPNDAPSQAAVLELGSNVSGGICNEAPDFYQVEASGRWRVDLNFTHAIGDLDIYAVDVTGQPIAGSDTVDDNESFEHTGPALIQVLGYNRASAPYTLTLVSLD